MENRGENIMTKDKLLAVGERYEQHDRGRQGRRRARTVDWQHGTACWSSCSSTCSRSVLVGRRARRDHGDATPCTRRCSWCCAFFTSAALWLLIEAEFLAIVLVLVYVGAVMVLFLFVVMMLDINVEKCARASRATLPLGGAGRG